jgi:hypothetical protein
VFSLPIPVIGVSRLSNSPGPIVESCGFLYYSGFVQPFARANLAAMLKPGGYLLSDDKLPKTVSSGLKNMLETTVCAGMSARRWVRGTHASPAALIAELRLRTAGGQNTLFGVPEISRHEAVFHSRL